MTETLHAGCVAIGGRGVLIAGRSGSGKSDLALRLIDRGAALVADDYVTVEARGGRLFAAPLQRIAGRIEIRGVGIVDWPFLDEAPLCLHVDLDRAAERLPEASAMRIDGLALPSLGLAALEPSAPIKLEQALRFHGLPLP